MSQIPAILIIIVTWNKKQYVVDLLDSVLTLDYPTEAIDIVVVDNASNDGTVEVLKTKYPHVHLICNTENLGGTGGFNTGLKWAFSQPENRYQYLWLLDNDVLVHRRALVELVKVLEAKPDIAIAGSTMMQLDYPWRINEMGAFVDTQYQAGHLILNRHLENIPAWQGKTATQLLVEDVDLSQHLMHCNPYMDVEYVAAASLLIRAEVAKTAGLWRDYFIHFDDVEWCLRIGALEHRVVVSAKSLIWHLSAAAKVPTWVLYYDNRNVLDLLVTHQVRPALLHHTRRLIYKKAVYYHLIGKPDLAALHHQAIVDFDAGRMGKRDIKLAATYRSNDKIAEVLHNSEIKRVLIAWTVNVHATRIQEALIQVQLQRPELQITFMPLLNGETVYQVPRPQFTSPLSHRRWKRWWQFWNMRGKYDLVIQSDYQAVIGLSWLNSKIVFINDEGFCLRDPPKWQNVLKAFGLWLKNR
jgi:GT2 family glycosyltransferase